MRYGLAWRALRHRRGQAVVLGLLAAIVVAACASGPLYERAVEQAAVRTTLTNTLVSDRGITLNTPEFPNDETYRQELQDAVRLFGQPQFGAELSVPITNKRITYQTTLTSRTNLCPHLRPLSGRCPAANDEVMLSQRLARALRLTVGQPAVVTLVPAQDAQPDQPAVPAQVLKLTVVGLYAPPSTAQTADEYWFDRGHYWTGVNAPSAALASDGQAASDAIFTTADTVDTAIQTVDTAPSNIEDQAVGGQRFLDAPLAVDHVGVDDLPLLRRTISRLQAEVSNQVSPGAPLPPPGSDATELLTGLSTYLDVIDHQRHIALSIVPLLAAQLALAALIVFIVATLAAAEQRRPELALARLRGGTRSGASRFFVREIGLLVAGGLVLGLSVAWVVAEVACRRWLVRGVQPELRWPVLFAVLGSGLAAVVVLAAVAWRTTGQPIGAMLRQVPPRRSRLGVGAVEAVIGALTVAGLVVIGSGSRDNPVAVVTPSLIGLLAGLIAGRLLVRVAPIVGRRALWRGHLDRAMAAFQLARRPGARLAVTLICLASALVVFATDAWSVSAHNRSARAGALTGAAVVLHVDAGSARQLIGAVHAADPSGAYATPVIIEQAPGAGAAVELAIDPGSFARVASWGWSDDRPTAAQLARITPHTARPITVTGTQLQLKLGPVKIQSDGPVDSSEQPAPLQPMFLRISLRRSDGSVVSADLGPLRAQKHDETLSGFMSCTDGCTVASIGLDRSPTDDNVVGLDASIQSMSAGSPTALKPVDLSGSNDWAAGLTPGSSPNDDTSVEVSHVGSGLRFQVVAGNGGAVAQHLDVPIAMPALIVGAAPDARDELGHITANNVDGQSAAFASAGQLPLAPRLGTPAMMIDLNIAARSAGSLASAVTVGSTDPMVWLGRADSGREKALVASLARSGVHVTGRDTSAAALEQLSASAPAWSMQLAITTGIIAALTAAGLLVMGLAATRRSRRDDLSALRVVGVRRSALRRGAVFEQLVVVLLSVVVGAAMGVVGAHLAMPSIPIFVNDQPVPVIRLPIDWPAVLVAAGLLAVGLVVIAVATALRLTRSIGGHQLREGQR
jgi:putative ABC transport system permease protein